MLGMSLYTHWKGPVGGARHFCDTEVPTTTVSFGMFARFLNFMRMMTDTYVPCFELLSCLSQNFAKRSQLLAFTCQVCSSWQRCSQILSLQGLCQSVTSPQGLGQFRPISAGTVTTVASLQGLSAPSNAKFLCSQTSALGVLK